MNVLNRDNLTPFQRQIISETTQNEPIKFRFGLMEMVKVFGTKIAIVHGTPGAYIYTTHAIVLVHSTHRTDAQNTKTLFHELVHSTALYLDRPIHRAGALRGTKVERAIEEVIAESGARMLMNFFGLNNPDVDAKMDAYIYEYLADLDASQRDHCLKETNRAVQLILDQYIPETVQRRIEGAA